MVLQPPLLVGPAALSAPGAALLSCPYPLRAHGRRCPGTVPLPGASGLFGLATGTRQGAATLLRVGQALAQQPQTALWITPEGSSPIRGSAVQLQPGLGHLARRLTAAAFAAGAGISLLGRALSRSPGVFWRRRAGRPATAPRAGTGPRSWHASLRPHRTAWPRPRAGTIGRLLRRSCAVVPGSAACMIAGVACAPGNAARHSSKHTGGRLMLLEVLAATTSLCAALPRACSTGIYASMPHPQCPIRAPPHQPWPS